MTEKQIPSKYRKKKTDKIEVPLIPKPLIPKPATSFSAFNKPTEKRNLIDHIKRNSLSAFAKDKTTEKRSTTKRGTNKYQTAKSEVVSSTEGNTQKRVFRPVSKNTQEHKKKQHLPPWSFLSCMMIDVGQKIQDTRPNLEFSKYLSQSLQQIERELLPVKDEHYRYMIFLVREQILGREKYDPKAWDKVSFAEPFDILLQQPCKMINFFFRYISLVLVSLKLPLKREERVELATIILASVNERTFECALNSQRRCNLNMILQHFRKHKITECSYCPFKTAMEDSC